MRGKVILCIVFVFIVKTAQGQNRTSYFGTEFWFTSIENNFAPKDSLELLVTPSKPIDTCYIFFPAINQTLVYPLRQGNYNRIFIPVSKVYNAHFFNPGRNPQPRGVRARTKHPSAMALFNTISGSNDATSVLPVDFLENGQSYIVHTVPGKNESGNNQACILAIDPGITRIKFRCPVSLRSGLPRDSSLDLKQGEVFTIMAASTRDMSGTTIEVVNSCKRVAVFAGTPAASLPLGSLVCGGQDILFEQLLPLALGGKKFSLPMPPSNTNYTLSILAYYNNTRVIVNGSVIGTINKGQKHEQVVNSGLITTVELDKPGSVFQFLHSSRCNGAAVDQGDPSQIYIGDDSATVTRFAFSPQIRPTTSIHKIKTITWSAAVPTIKVNGIVRNPTAPYTSVLTASGNAFVAEFDILENSTYLFETSAPTLAYAYGQTLYESYGLCLGSSPKNSFADAKVSPTFLCNPKQVVNFEAVGDSVTNILWLFGDGRQASGNKTSHNYGTKGTYIAKMIRSKSASFCKADTISKTIVIHQEPEVKLPKDTFPCLGQSLKISLVELSGVSYKWQNGSTRNTYTIPGDTTVYLTITDSNGCKRTDTMLVKFQDCDTTSLKISNVFTPGTDGFNDKWMVYHLGFEKVQIKIVNRWGAVVAAYNLPESEDWNGRVMNSGTHCPEGTYFYTITTVAKRSKIKKTISGPLVLIRN